MLRPSHLPPGDPRKGVILIVVIVLLTLFAVIGLTFMLYADAQATSSRIFKEAYNLDDDRPDESPYALLNFALGQLLYDTDDKNNPYSGLRGHSLARTIYGWDSDAPGSNIYPFNGTGRLRHETYQF